VNVNIATSKRPHQHVNLNIVMSKRPHLHVNLNIAVWGLRFSRWWVRITVSWEVTAYKLAAMFRKNMAVYMYMNMARSGKMVLIHRNT
jgi:hypothetical protein